MQLSEEEIAVIYARACRAWYGRRALRIVRDQVKKMNSVGDVTGFKVWKRIETELHKTVSRRHTAASENGKLYS
jgi:hypothetical protein